MFFAELRDIVTQLETRLNSKPPMISQLLASIEKSPNITHIFCDYYDTIVHRNTHPLQPLKIWAKFMIREMGLSISTETLYQIRKSTFVYLSKDEKKKQSELSYDMVMAEVFKRLLNTGVLDTNLSFPEFLIYSMEADFIAESSVQHRNDNVIATLRELKKRGYQLYLVSDFHFDEALMCRLLDFHGLSKLYDKVFVSAAMQASKENKGLLYKRILEKESLQGENVFMLGDNDKSDVAYANLHAIKAFRLNHGKYHVKHKFKLLVGDEKDVTKTLRGLEKELKSKQNPYAEYLIFFHFFVERLYARAKKDKIKNLFFLAREGHFLKRLFDLYQERSSFGKATPIRTHYLKISRQASRQIALKPIAEEDFRGFRRNHSSISPARFLKSFFFKEEEISSIATRLAIDVDLVILGFFESEVFKQIKKDEIFKTHYRTHRLSQQECFDSYMQSFGVDYDKETVHIVDVGWGGTMQESLYDYFKGRQKVEGHYLGLNEIYQITPRTKREGYLFSVYPFESIYDRIMAANRQLFEQLLAAPHGSALGYTKAPDYVLEYHKPEELMVYTNFIAGTQEFMINQYAAMVTSLAILTYEDKTVFNFLLHLKLRMDLQANRDKIHFLNNLTKGFYQNVGNHKVGLKYDYKNTGLTVKTAIKQFLIRPENIYRYLAKLKLALHQRKLGFLSGLVNLCVPYIKTHLYLRKKIFKRNLFSLEILRRQELL